MGRLFAQKEVSMKLVTPLRLLVKSRSMITTIDPIKMKL